jgi:hypothetical protein
VFRTDFFHSFPATSSSLDLPDAGPIDYPVNLDGVVGNPPYIRFENRTDQERQEIVQFLEKSYARQQLPYPNFTGKADIWAFFVAGAHLYLRPGGRLGFVLSWNLLASDYGDAVLAFLARYFVVDAIIDSRVERMFAAKQNTLILLARKAEDPVHPGTNEVNLNVPREHLVHFVRLKQPIATLLDTDQPRGKQAEDLVDGLLATSNDVGDDVRWDVRTFRQDGLAFMSARHAVEDEEADVTS